MPTLPMACQIATLPDLSKIADLKVISRTSTRSSSAINHATRREIGQQLGVDHLLEGSVERSGDRLRIHAQLIDTRSDSHLWAQTYDRQVADIFADRGTRDHRQIADQLMASVFGGCESGP